MVFYSYGWTPLQSLYPTECLPYEVRAKGLALVGWATNVVSLINTFGLPSALAKIGWKSEYLLVQQELTGSIPHLRMLRRHWCHCHLDLRGRDKAAVARGTRRRVCVWFAEGDGCGAPQAREEGGEGASARGVVSRSCIACNAMSSYLLPLSLLGGIQHWSVLVLLTATSPLLGSGPP